MEIKKIALAIASVLSVAQNQGSTTNEAARFSDSSTKIKQKENAIQAIILAAGKGSRFKTGISKLVYPICGRAIFLYPVKLIASLNIPVTLIVGYQQHRIRKVVKDAKLENINLIEQKEQKGTGHALLCSKPVWNSKNILVLNGDGPMLIRDLIKQLCDVHIQSHAAISFVVSHYIDDGAYGRLVEQDGIVKIVEAKHFSYTKDQFPYINAGIYIINREFLQEYWSKLEQNEKTNEFYLTDLVEIASKNDLVVKTVVAPYNLIRGVNTLKELSDAQQIKKNEMIENFMANGVQFENPVTVHIDIDVEIGAGTYIGSGVQLHGKTIIGKNCKIGPYSILKNVGIEDKTTIEAFSKRPDVDLFPAPVSKPLFYRRHNFYEGLILEPDYIEESKE